MSEDETLLKAIYETKREQTIIAWLNPNTRDWIDTAYAYATSCRMFPCFHVGDSSDPFASVYDIDQDFIEKVVKYVDEIWQKDNANIADSLTFYALETHFGGHHTNRCELLAIFRYVKLSRRMNDAFFKKLLSDAPIEADGIIEPFEAMEISIP